MSKWSLGELLGNGKRAGEAVNRYSGECESSVCLRKGGSREGEELAED